MEERARACCVNIIINHSINGFECIMCEGTLGHSLMQHYPNEVIVGWWRQRLQTCGSEVSVRWYVDTVYLLVLLYLVLPRMTSFVPLLNLWCETVRFTINKSCKLHGVLLAYKLLHTTIQVSIHTNSLMQVYTAVWTGSCLTNGSRTCTYILLTLFMAFGPWCSLDKKYWWQCGVNGTISLYHVIVKLMNISYWHTIM